MRSFLLILIWAALAEPAFAASNVKTPYETVVEAEETFVRSGPGKSKFYPTGKLRRGEKVVVHRHDPGGWCMIAPPPGSFSWVPAKYVQKSGTDRGTITTNSVAARVGSFESDIRKVFQRTLAQGDEVHILLEKMLASDTGGGAPELWYRIEPPRGEWRWVAGQDLAPPPDAGSRSPTDDPFEAPVIADRARPTASLGSKSGDESPTFEKPLADPSNREYASDPTDQESRQPPIATRPLVRKENKAAKGKPVNRTQDGILDELDGLDARFRSILDQPVLEWDFGQLEHDYQLLWDSAESGSIKRMIDTRLTRIADYRKTRGAEEEIARIQAETARRDAELTEIQRRQEAQLASLREPRFDGAGIINRSALNRRGAPRFVLLAPGGRVLAYLVPAAGVNLESWVGRAAGVNGSRVRHPDLKADLITVNRLSPVRLVP